MALEVKLGQDLRLRQQLVMTPQLQQAIKILQLSLPELEAVVQTELDSWSGDLGGFQPVSLDLTAFEGQQVQIYYRFTSDSQSFQQTLASLGGANIVDTNADIQRTITALATYACGSAEMQ